MVGRGEGGRRRRIGEASTTGGTTARGEESSGGGEERVREDQAHARSHVPVCLSVCLLAIASEHGGRRE